ncbi:branched-chain amino acid ABC transporter permease [Iodobacter fluviatilis]|uniref:Amino acid/amide ABC transporter membrane protein 2 (HAAT family) n=2 Tax=Iodobacter fluviatilis TaxID=537 RepID=A0A377Q8C1_9NEIS|nr:branched-chain amino acid ABC transporter permease [Iodobacter fluviatilis]TCU88434.1 amino acid/amide ABC transporter membrane protein 2 (HAAT family) [Iodobacter fluviatilis]STQ91494.1 leucine/isoleucine/valine transporter permease subunit [Iodobacter fluviatilis]
MNAPIVQLVPAAVLSRKKTSFTPWIAALIFASLAPFVVYPIFAMELMCFALFACAFNLLLGFGGLLSFGHAAFFGSAAYLCGHAIKNWGLSPELGILFATCGAALLGLAIGSIAIRRQGIYFAMVTLALAQIVFFLCLQLPFTGGEDGLQGIPKGHLFGLIDLSATVSVGQQQLPLALYFFVLAITFGGYWLIWRTVHSPFGMVLKAIKENEPRALSLGYQVNRYKLATFVLSAALAGLAGATKALVVGLASLSDVSWHMSGEVVLMTLLGGMGTLLGPVVGAVTVGTLHHELASFGSWVTVTIGVVFVVCVMAFRRGIVGEIAYRLKRDL